MKKIRTVLAFLLVFVLMFGNSARAFAADSDNPTGTDGNTTTEGTTGDNTDPTPAGSALYTYTGADATPDGKIVIGNASIGETYAVYKIFDATLSSDKQHIAYTIKAGDLKSKLEEPAGKAIFTIGDTPDAKGNYYVTQKAGVNPDDVVVYLRGIIKDMPNYFANNKIGEILSASDKTITFQSLPYGYYYVTSSVGGVVSIDSTKPVGILIDKNQKPDFDKYIYGGKDEDGNDIKIRVNEANLDDPIDFKIVVKATNYIHIENAGKGEDKKIFIYQINDKLDPGMTYITQPTIKVNGEDVDPRSIVFYAADDVTETTELSQAQSFVIELNWTNDGTFKGEHLYQANAEITVEYKAILDSNKSDKIVYGVAGGATGSETEPEDPNNETTEPTEPDEPTEGEEEETPSYIDANTNVAHTDYYSFQWDEEPPEEEPTEPDGTLGTRITETFTTWLTILKVNELNLPMDGAGFTLTNQKGERVVLSAEEKFVEDAEGTYWLLNNGTYTTTDPSGEGIDTSVYASTETKYKKTVEVKTVLPPENPNHSITGMVDSEGKVVFKGLGTGEYLLTESTVPAGYVKIDDIAFNVGFSVTTEHIVDADGFPIFSNPKFFIADDEGNEVEDGEAPITLEGNTGLFTSTIQNIPGTRLPGVGGRGTVAFYLIGGAMVIGAAALLVMKRRRREEE